MRANGQGKVDQNGFEPLPRLNVFILYEDRATGLRAKESLDHFVSQVDFDLGYSLDVCRFDLLEDNEVRQSTAQQSATTDVVVVALRNGHDLPIGLRYWLSKWLHLKGDRPCAVVVVNCDGPAPIAGSARRRIDFAQIPPQANVEVFECVRSLERSTFDAVLEQLRYRENSSSDVLEQILHRREPFTHWGIND